jgi:3-hydroxyisobutyrate dehydrogenase-like beta-hydroxyacid dehydrogenase
MPQSQKRVAVIGLGLMGRAMSTRLLEAGYTVSGYDLSDVANAAAAELGVQVASSAEAALPGSSHVILSLMTSQNCRDLLWGGQNLAATLSPGMVVLDTTTAGPEDIQEDYARLFDERNVRLIDVCVSGSSQVVLEGRALALVGDREEGATYRDLLATFTAAQYFLGTPGRGNEAKLIVNLVFGLNRLVLAEALGLAKHAGFDLAMMLEILRRGETYSTVMDTKGPKMLANQYEPAVARLSQHAKDVRLIMDYATALGANVPLTKVHSTLIEQLVQAGYGDLDNAAIFKAFETP